MGRQCNVDRTGHLSTVLLGIPLPEMAPVPAGTITTNTTTPFPNPIVSLIPLPEMAPVPADTTVNRAPARPNNS